MIKRRIISVVLLVAILLGAYRCIIRQITNIKLMEIGFIEIDLNEEDSWRNFFSATELELIKKMPERYHIVRITYQVEDKSNQTSICWLDVYPKWNKKAKEMIVSSNAEWAVAPMNLRPNTKRSQSKYLIVDTKGYTEAEAIKMLKQIKGVGISVTGNSPRRVYCLIVQKGLKARRTNV